MRGQGWRSEKVRRPREDVEPHLRLLLCQFVTGNPYDPPELHVAGSWRRGAPVVGDIDIVIVSDGGTLTGDLMTPGVLLPTCVEWDRQGDKIAQGTMPIDVARQTLWQGC